MNRLVYLRRLWVLMATVFLDMVGYLLVLPLLPFYAKEMSAPDWMVGVLLSTFAVAQLATAPVWGWLSDHVGRRPVILGSLVLSILAFILFGLADTVWLLLLSRLFQGMGGGTVGVVQAYVSDVVPPKVRTQALGWVTVATSVGVMLGPGLGSWSIQFGTWAPGFLAAGLCLLNLIFAGFFLPEAERDEGYAEEDREEDRKDARKEESGEAVRPEGLRDLLGNLGQLGTAFRRILGHPGSPLARLIWIYALTMMGFMAMNGVMVLYLERVFGFEEQNIGYFYVFVGAVSFLMRGLLLGPVVNRLGETRTLRVGAVCILLAYFLIPFTSNETALAWMRDLMPASVTSPFFTNLVLLAPAIMLIPVGTALLFPATTSLVSQKSKRRETGQSLGVQQAFGGVARVLGPLWATAVFQFIHIDSPFWINVALMVLVVALTLKVKEGERYETRPESGSDPADALHPLEAE